MLLRIGIQTVEILCLIFRKVEVRVGKGRRCTLALQRHNEKVVFEKKHSYIIEVLDSVDTSLGD